MKPRPDGPSDALSVEEIGNVPGFASKERPHCLPFSPDRFPDRVGSSEVSADSVIRSHLWYVQDRFHFFNVGDTLHAENGFITVLAAHGFLRLDVHNFPDEKGMLADLHRPDEPAFHVEGKLHDG